MNSRPKSHHHDNESAGRAHDADQELEPSGTGGNSDRNEQSAEAAATGQTFADAAAGNADAALETRDEAMQRMAAEVEQAQQRVLMAQAELENFRKRTRKDYEDQLRFAALPLVEDLLLVRDNLKRAIDAASSSADSTEGLRAGVEMVAKQLDDALAKHGIKPIAAIGQPFDPNVHQAISQTPSHEHAEGTVAIEAATGFQMHNRVVRPSQVVVSTGSPSA